MALWDQYAMRRSLTEQSGLVPRPVLCQDSSVSMQENMRSRCWHGLKIECAQEQDLPPCILEQCILDVLPQFLACAAILAAWDCLDDAVTGSALYESV